MACETISLNVAVMSLCIQDLSSRQGEQVTPVAQSRGAEGRVPGDCLSLSAGKGGIEVDRSLYDADHTHSVM